MALDTGSYTVSHVARLARVSVRTLRHYDEIGLLRPSGRSGAGYRLYDRADLERLQHVLYFKELGFGLENIGRIMNDPGFDRENALVTQRELLAGKGRRIEEMLGAIDRALAAMERGVAMDEKDMFEVFGDFDPKEYEDEVKERWGDSDAYTESTRRTARYTKEDWRRFKEESERIGLAIAAAMDAGLPPDSEVAMDAVERHRLQIDRWFYPCSHEMQVNLGKMYVADPRFTATYEKIRTGMAQYVCDAIEANAARARR